MSKMVALSGGPSLGRSRREGRGVDQVTLDRAALAATARCAATKDTLNGHVKQCPRPRWVVDQAAIDLMLLGERKRYEGNIEALTAALKNPLAAYTDTGLGIASFRSLKVAE